MRRVPPPRGVGALSAVPAAVPAGPRRAGLVLIAVAASVVVLDWAAKELVLARLVPGRFVPLIGDVVGWQLVFNPGAAFGIPLPAPVFPVVTAVVVAVVVRSLKEAKGVAIVVAQGLVVGGALGNLLDRAIRPGDGPLGGLVVDYVAWGSFPRFNVADAAITVGVAGMLLLILRDERRSTANA